MPTVTSAEKLKNKKHNKPNKKQITQNTQPTKKQTIYLSKVLKNIEI